MSRDFPQLKIRMSPEFKSKIEKSAKDNGRSINAEIINRLELSLIADQSSRDLLTALQARSLLANTIENGTDALLSKCFASIKESIRNGYTFSIVDPDLEAWDLVDPDDEIYLKIILPAKEKLVELGYRVEIDGDNLYIRYG